MNVLKRIIIPKLENTIRYIIAEMEELEREDTFRLKRVKQNNMKRAKQRAKQDGAGERIEVIDPKIEKEDKLKTKSAAKSETSEKPDKDKEFENTDNIESKPIQPKEAAEMGDLIVIKPPDDTLLMGDAPGPQTGLKHTVTITEAEKLIDRSEFEEKEKNNNEGISTEGTQFNDDVFYDDLEAGEWFETAHTTVNDKPSAYSKMDEYEDVLGTIRIDVDSSIDSVDLDKRGLASLYKSIDSNFYKPTIDDLFSKHDIAMQDVSTHSLVDLESIDFSIDSKGKVIPSRHGTGQSSPALSHREVDTTKPQAKYNKEGILISPTGSLPSVGGQGIVQIEDPLQSQVENNVIAEQIDDVTETKVSIMDDNNEAEDDMTTGDLIEPEIDVESLEEKIGKNQDLEDKDLKLYDIDEIEDKNSIESQDRDINDIITNDSSTKFNEESKTKQIVEGQNVRKLEARLSRSISHDKLSRISEEDNLEADTSKLSTLVELRENGAEGSVVLDKYSNSKSSLYKNENLKANKELELNIDSNLLEKEEPEPVESEKAIKYSPDEMNEFDHQRHSKLTIDEKQEHFEPVRSARSSRDLQHNIIMQNIDKNISQELPNTLNSIVEENEAVSSDIRDRTVKETVTDDDIKTNYEGNKGENNTIQLSDKSRRNNQVKDADITDRKIGNYEDIEKHKKEIEDTTVKKSDDSLDVEEKTMKIRDSTEITKSKLDVRKQHKSQLDEKHTNNANSSIQLKRKSQVKQELEYKPLTIKSSHEIIEPKQEDTINRDIQIKDDDKTDNGTDQKEKSERDDKEGDSKSDNESSPSADKPERHSGDDHLKQD